jgi:hypothetical protein
MSQTPGSGDPLVERWVETWRRAGAELEAIRRVELASVDTREALRQIFEGELPILPPSAPTSGLIEQQAWFARLRHRQ